MHSAFVLLVPWIIVKEPVLKSDQFKEISAYFRRSSLKIALIRKKKV